MAIETVHSLRFNQDQRCFVCTSQYGIRIFSVSPLQQLCLIDNVGSVEKAEMLHRTNMLAFIPGGTGRTSYSSNAALIYDIQKGSLCLDSAFQSKVLNIRLRRDKLIVVLTRKTIVFSFPGQPKKIKSVDTYMNIDGLCEVSPLSTSDKFLMVVPGMKVGSIQIEDLSSNKDKSSHAVIINAHQTEIRCIALNQKASKVATASQRGTLIRVFSTSDRSLLSELRRGSDEALLYSINFSHDDQYLCCSSDKGTVHVFALMDTRCNKSSRYDGSFNFFTYVKSQWAVATLSIPTDGRFICAFGPNADGGKTNRVFVICYDGTVIRAAFNESKKTLLREGSDSYLDAQSLSSID